MGSNMKNIKHEFEIKEIYKLYLKYNFRLFKDGHYSFNGRRNDVGKVCGWYILENYNNSKEE